MLSRHTYYAMVLGFFGWIVSMTKAFLGVASLLQSRTRTLLLMGIDPPTVVEPANDSLTYKLSLDHGYNYFRILI